MCKRQAGEKLLEEEKGLDGIIDDIGEDHAKLILDRLELLSKLREIAKHPKLEERLKLCENNLDTPDWWEPGKHDRELVRAVLKYGLYRSDQYILNDTEFPFADAEKRYVRNLEVLKSFKLDNPADLFKLAMGEMAGKSSKPESKVETPVPVKKDEKPFEEPATSIEPEVTETPEKIEAIQEDKQESPIKSPESLKTIDENIPAVDTEPKPMDEDLPPESPKPEVTTELEKESPVEIDSEKPLVDVDESKEISTEIEPTEAENTESEDKKLPEPEVPIVVETSEEKDEKEKICEEKSEPKVDEVPDEVPVIADEEKSPLETPVEEIETKKTTEETPVEIKEEPGIERPEGEPKIIDTVVIDDDDTLPEKPSVKSPETSTQAAELRARFPDLEVFQPLMKLKQLDAMMKGDIKDNLKSLSRVFDTSMVVKWFRDFALEKRISHIIYCVEKGVWPVGKSYSAYSGCLGIDLDLPLYETVKRINALDDKRSSASTPDIITITTDHHQLGKSGLSANLQAQLHQSMAAMTSKGKKGQKRHIAIDVETERAKLHALLNNTTPLAAGSQKSQWDDEDTSRRSSTSSNSALQPPPAHQPASRASMSQYKPTVTIPGTSSTLTPIDLSSR